MANTFLTPDIIAREALATLYEDLVMAALVHRDFSSEFDGAVGDTITVRKPTTFTAQEFTSTISVQNATETGVPVVLDTLLDVSFAVTAKDMALEIQDFGAQLLAPAMEAHAQAIDDKLLTLRDDVVAQVGDGTSTHTWDDGKVLIDARKTLSEAKVPQSERRAVVGPSIAAEWLDDELFVQADQSGSTQALTEANLGRKFQFNVFEHNGISEGAGELGEPFTEVGVAFHRTAFALVSRTLPLPRGTDSSRAAVVGYKGFGLRVVNDYDIDAKQDVVSVDYLIGVKTLDANRAVLIQGEATPATSS